jgi:hypothetical protein
VLPTHTYINTTAHPILQLATGVHDHDAAVSGQPALLWGAHDVLLSGPDPAFGKRVLVSRCVNEKSIDCGGLPGSAAAHRFGIAPSFAAEYFDKLVSQGLQGDSIDVRDDGALLPRFGRRRDTLKIKIQHQVLSEAPNCCRARCKCSQILKRRFSFLTALHW